MNNEIDLASEQHRIYRGAAAAFAMCALDFRHLLGANDLADLPRAGLLPTGS